MTQPKFAPILPHDEVRDLYKLPVPPSWKPHRPADFDPGDHRAGGGVAGPDQGYALLLAERFADRLVLRSGEHEEDVLSGAAAIALRRAASFGRAPVSGDLEVALELFGFLSEAPDEIAAARSDVFDGVAHDYWRERELAGVVRESTLRLNLKDLRRELDDGVAARLELSGLGGGGAPRDG